jgi:stringent starvation protein B
MESAAHALSTRPYLIRAIYEWCTDMSYTPYLAVYVDDTVQVPREYVRNNEIVLNISFDATSNLQLGNEFVEFNARFQGVSRAIIVPVNRVIAIYALENGQGMAFPVQQLPHSVGPAPAEGLAPARSGLADSALHASAPAKRLTLVANELPAAVAPTATAPEDEPPTPPDPPKRPTLTRVK